MSNRFWIGQVVRPSGTVLTETLSPEQHGPRLDIPDITIGQDPIVGPAYGRWRLSDADEWQVTYWWPNGPGSLPAFCDHTGEGAFASMNPADPAMPRDEVPQILRPVTNGGK